MPMHHWLRTFWRQTRCRHSYRWRENLHGDRITAAGGNRSRWQCSLCGAVQYRPTLAGPSGEQRILKSS